MNTVIRQFCLCSDVKEYPFVFVGTEEYCTSCLKRIEWYSKSKATLLKVTRR